QEGQRLTMYMKACNCEPHVFVVPGFVRPRALSRVVGPHRLAAVQGGATGILVGKREGRLRSRCRAVRRTQVAAALRRAERDWIGFELIDARGEHAQVSIAAGLELALQIRVRI